MNRSARYVLLAHVPAVLVVVLCTWISIHGPSSLRAAGITLASISIGKHVMCPAYIAHITSLLFATSESVLAAFLVFSIAAILLGAWGSVVRLRNTADTSRLPFSWLPGLLTTVVMGSMIPAYSVYTSSYQRAFEKHHDISYAWIGSWLAVTKYQGLLVLEAVGGVLLLGWILEKTLSSPVQTDSVRSVEDTQVVSEVVDAATSGKPFYYRQTQTPDRDVSLCTYGWVLLCISCLYLCTWLCCINGEIFWYIPAACFSLVVVPAILSRLLGASIAVIPESVVMRDRFFGHKSINIPIASIRKIEYGSADSLMESGGWKQALTKIIWENRSVHGYGSRSGVKITTKDNEQHILLSNDPEKLAKVLKGMMTASQDRVLQGIATPTAGAKAQEKQKEDDANWSCLAIIGLFIGLNFLVGILFPEERSLLSFISRALLWILAAIWIGKDMLERRLPDTVGKWRDDTFWGVVLTLISGITSALVVSGGTLKGSDRHEYMVIAGLLWANAVFIWIKVTIRRYASEHLAISVLAWIISAFTLSGLFPNWLSRSAGFVSADEIRLVERILLVVCITLWTAVANGFGSHSENDGQTDEEERLAAGKASPVVRLLLLVGWAAVSGNETYLRVREAFFSKTPEHLTLADLLVFIALWGCVGSMWQAYRESLVSSDAKSAESSNSDARP